MEKLQTELEKNEEQVHALQTELEKLRLEKVRMKNKERRLKRKERSIGLLQQGNATPQLGKTMKETLKPEIIYLQKEKTKMQKQVWYQKTKRRQYQDSVSSIFNSEEVEVFKTRIVELEKEITRLQQINSLLEKHEVETFRDGMFTDDVREVIMQLLAKQVSMNSVSEVIKIVLEKVAHLKVEKLPSKS